MIRTRALALLVSAPTVTAQGIPDECSCLFTDRPPFQDPELGQPVCGPNRHLYFRTNDPVTFHQARAIAERVGGYLVHVNDAAERSFLVGQFGFGAYWIGLTDEAVEGTWVWESGEPLTYESWANGYPDGCEYAHPLDECGNYDYAMMSVDSLGNWTVHPSEGIFEFGFPMRAIIEVPVSVVCLLVAVTGAPAPTGRSVAGHAGLELLPSSVLLQNPGVEVARYGFYPRDSSYLGKVWGPGKLNDDANYPFLGKTCYAITDQELNALSASIAADEASTPGYRLNLFNCASWALSELLPLGLPVPDATFDGTIIAPNSLWENMDLLFPTCNAAPASGGGSGVQGSGPVEVSYPWVHSLAHEDPQALAAQFQLDANLVDLALVPVDSGDPLVVQLDYPSPQDVVFSVDWGDGTVEYQPESLEHTYAPTIVLPYEASVVLVDQGTVNRWRFDVLVADGAPTQQVSLQATLDPPTDWLNTGFVTPSSYPVFATTSVLGPGCGVSPEAYLTATAPAFGETTILQHVGLPASSLGVLVLGAPFPGGFPIGAGCNVYLDPTPGTQFPVPFFASDQGLWTLPLAIPDDPTLVGALLGAQTVVLNAAAPLGYELTNGLLLALGA